jgi:phospholipid/cholesterol/gamma-HCH transport system substrate-binding protein
MSNKALGYLTIISLVLFVILVAVMQIRESNRYCTRPAYADDIGNLKIENPVNVNGIEVGVVKSIGRKNEKAFLTLRILEEVEIKSDYLLLNKDVSLTGDRALTLMPGTSGEVVPVDSPLYAKFIGGIAEGISSAESLEDLVVELREIVKQYSEVDPSNDSLFTTRIKELLKFVDKASAEIDLLVRQNESTLEALVAKTGNFTGNLKEMSRKYAPQADKVIGSADSLAVKTINLINELAPAVAKIESLLNELERSDNSLMGLVANGKAYEDLGKTVSKIRSLIRIMGEDGVGLDIDIF